MIERQFIAQRTKEFYIQKFVEESLGHVGISSIKLRKIPLGEKIVVCTSRPSLIVGSKGSNIKALTKELKKRFQLENPQIEIDEVKDIFLDANVVAERIVSSLERFGSARFKGAGHKVMENVMNAGALGVEIIISGKIPGARAKSWRFYQGYLKKCGDIAITGVRKSKKTALLKSGIIGVKVSIMPPDLILPDSISLLSEPIKLVEVVKVADSEKIKKVKDDELKKGVSKKSTSASKKQIKRPAKSTVKKNTKKENKPEPEISAAGEVNDNKVETKTETSEMEKNKVIEAGDKKDNKTNKSEQVDDNEEI